MRILIILIALLSIILSLGCQADTTNGGAQPVIPTLEVTPASMRLPNSSSQEVATPDRMDEVMTKLPERVPPTEEVTSITGEVPAELLDSIRKDLAGQTGVALDTVTVVQAQAITWNDGSLGCAKPGEFYTQALVNGYRVILELEGTLYDYHATDRGYFFLCEGKFLPNPSASTPSS